MDIEKMIVLLREFSNSNLETFKYEEGNMKIKFKNKADINISANEEAVYQNPIAISNENGEALSNTTLNSQYQDIRGTSLKDKGIGENNLNKEEPAKEDNNNFIVESPTVGIFYESSSPDTEAFVQVGDVIKKGQVVGIVEAMKVMNEIESPVDGVVEEILVENEELVEFGQGLIAIKLV